MAEILLKNLYPPIIDSYMPAFLRVDSCRVYFSLSRYNSIQDVNMKAIQLLVKNQNTNKSAWDGYEIKLTEIKEDSTRKTSDRYYIEIFNEDIKGGFASNTFYKVQLRFTGAQTPEPPEDINLIPLWINNNLDNFSEWSTVCLIKGISEPEVKSNFTEGDESSKLQFVSNQMIHFVGKVLFNDTNEQETLRSYHFKITDLNNTMTFYESDEILADTISAINEINYNIPYQLENNVQYQLKLYITTRNLYQSEYSYPLSFSPNSSKILDVDYAIEPDSDNARFIIKINPKNYIGNISITRTSDDSNFKTWKEIKILNVIDTTQDEILFSDFTIESGKWYKYAIAESHDTGERGIAISLTEEPIMLEFEHIFLVSKDRQLKIKFDASISSFKRNISENKTETIGSKYPFFIRNGNVNYYEFPLSGTISFLMDDNAVFTSKEELFVDSYTLYNSYKEEKNLTDYNDYLYEKKFRDKVTDFLYDSGLKLFKSATEGNYIVRLSNINLSPNNQLSKYIYSFSCTVSEIALNSITNCNKYNIQTIGTLVSDDILKNIIAEHNVFGQISNVNNDLTGRNIIALITEKEQVTGYSVELSDFSYLKISISGSPDTENGFKFILNNKTIYTQGIYTLEDDNGFNINSLIFNTNYDSITIEYKVKVLQIETDTPQFFDTSYVITLQKELDNRSLPEQSYDYNENIVDMLKDLINVGDIQFVSIVNLDISNVSYGTVIKVKNTSGVEEKYIINDMQSLILQDTSLSEVSFYGKRYFRNNSSSRIDKEKFSQQDLEYLYDNHPVDFYYFDINDGLPIKLTNSLGIDLNRVDMIEVKEPVSALVTCSSKIGVKERV